ncbi:MAG: aldolase catalytic domain-containing protein, partial [Lentisphaeria bacterium]|nr:aldolase catalytic domain-containing protein [Lentisphaeria bacterium]
MMDKKIQLLDCTLRDGCYIVDSKFGDPLIKGLLKRLYAAGIDIIECGWLKNDPHKEGSAFFHLPDDLMPYLPDDPKQDRLLCLMIDWDRYDLSKLPPYSGRGADVIRMVFPHGRSTEAIALSRKIIEAGYKLFFQAANTLSYSNEELTVLAYDVNRSGAEALSIVDTFGAMYPADLERIFHVLDHELDPGIKLGFHSHNNQQLSFALSIKFAELSEKSKRNIIIDSSLSGLGRGAGNATTELVSSYLNRLGLAHYDMNEILDAIDTYIDPLKANFSWGYNTSYFISGYYCCHVNNIAYLKKNHRTLSKDMRLIIESLSPADRL